MELSAIELRARAEAAKTPVVVVRILALALVLEGMSRETAAKLAEWIANFARRNSDSTDIEPSRYRGARNTLNPLAKP
jgi:hypothetical protein